MNHGRRDQESCRWRALSLRNNKDANTQSVLELMAEKHAFYCLENPFHTVLQLKWRVNSISMNRNTHVTVKPHGNVSNTSRLVPTHLHRAGAATWLKPPAPNGDILTYGNGGVEWGNTRADKDIMLIIAWQTTTDAWWMFVDLSTCLTAAKEIKHDKLISMAEARREWSPRSVKRLWQLSTLARQRF